MFSLLEFFCHSHQCPTNLLHDVMEVYGPDGDHDPHGLIRYVACVDDTPMMRTALEDGPSLHEVMKLFCTDGELPPTEWPERNGGLLPMVAEWRREELNKA